jgi:hypothetical protein
MLGGDFQGAAPPRAKEVAPTATRKIGLGLVRAGSRKSDTVNSILVGRTKIP